MPEHTFMQHPRSIRRLLLPSLALLSIVGCLEPQSASSAWSGPARGRGDSASRLVPNATLDTIRPVASRVFRSAYRLDPDRSTGTMLVSRPVEAAGEQHGERIRDVLGRPNRHRRLATLGMSQDGTAVMLQCQVRIERLDTTEQAAFARNRGDDRPNDTPIERLGVDAPSAREEWVYVSRDRQAEADILDAIASHFAPTRPAGD